MLQITAKTVEVLKQRFVEQRFEACIERKPYPEIKEIKADGDFAAHLLTLSCSKAPQEEAVGRYACWQIKLEELNYAKSASHETVRQVPKKNEIKPWKVKGWIIAPLQNGDLVAHMERVLDVYKTRYNTAAYKRDPITDSR